MPCELGVASLFAPRPASLGVPPNLGLGILAAGLQLVLAADCAPFRIPLAVPSPGAAGMGQENPLASRPAARSAGTSISNVS